MGIAHSVLIRLQTWLSQAILVSYWSISRTAFPLKPLGQMIRVITKLPNSEQSYKGKVKTHNYVNRQNQSTTGKL